MTLSELQQLSLDLSSALTVSKVSINGKRAAQFSCRAGKLRIRLTAKLVDRCSAVDRGALRRHPQAAAITLGRGRFRGTDRWRAGGGTT